MKIPIISKDFKFKTLYLQKTYTSTKNILPIGCDCHVAYTLQHLELRTHSLPFDWLNTDPIKGLSFVADNIENNFEDFLVNITKNERGHNVAQKYPEAEFMHEKTIDTDVKVQEKFKRRIERFIKLYHEHNSSFVYIFNTYPLTEANYDEVYQSILRLTKLLKGKDTFHLYFSTEDNDFTNKELVNKLQNSISTLPNMYSFLYYKNAYKHGLWGDSEYYNTLLKNLKLPLKFKNIKAFIR